MTDLRAPFGLLIVGLALGSVRDVKTQTIPQIEVAATRAQWLLHPATAPTFTARTQGVTLSATRWLGHRSLGAYGLLAPSRDDAPALFGMAAQFALRSTQMPTTWRPFVYGAGAGGLLDVAPSMELVLICETATGRCQFDNYHAGWQPLLAATAGLEVPLPWRAALRAEVGADIGGPFGR